MRGKFIVIEGSDGVGKGTQTKLLTDYLHSIDRSVRFYDFPQYEKSFFGTMVARYLNGEFGDVGDSDPYLVSLLYAGDRWEAAEGIKKDLQAGHVVISNRYIQSNMAFQTAKIKNPKDKQRFLRWLERLEFGVYKIPKPDTIVYLYAPYHISQAMVDSKGGRKYTKQKRDIHERNTEFLRQVEKEYLRLARQKHWLIINCAQNDKILSREEIHCQVVNSLRRARHL
jgi:dTMP kinase